MIRPDRIKSEMFGGVGWRQPTLTGMPVIDSDNLESKSGLRFQDGSSSVTIQNIIDCQQDSEISTDDFNDYIKSLQESCILEVCQKVQENESDFIQSVNLYPYEKTFFTTIEPSGKFVGFKVERTVKVNKSSKINWIELTFDSDITFDVHLYNSNLPNAPIKTVEVTTVANESTIVALDDWEIADGETFKGGVFYWGYFEDDLSGAKALKKDYENSILEVSTLCNYVVPVTMDHSGDTIDIESVDEKSDTYGLNFGLDTYNDYTELFIRNKSMFYQPIQYQMAEKTLGIIRTAVRSNNIQRLTKDFMPEINLEIYGNREAAIIGINGKLRRSIETLRKAFFYKPKIKRSTIG